MALQNLECPHCRLTSPMRSEGYADRSTGCTYFFFMCPTCRSPLAVLAEAHKPGYEYRRSYNVSGAEQSFAKCGWRVIESWPKPLCRRVELMPGVPDEIASFFAYAQEAALSGGLDFAMLGYLTALKRAQAKLSPGIKQKPHAWVLSLIDSGKLNEALRPWADRVKGLRSEAKNSTVQDAEEFATFVQVVFEQLFSISSRAEAFRRRAANS